MFKPPHPGKTIMDLCIEPLDLTITKAADDLGVHRRTLSLIINGHSGISSEMAIRLEKVFGSSARAWLNLQIQYDLWKVEHNTDIREKLKNLKKAA